MLEFQPHVEPFPPGNPETVHPKIHKGHDISRRDHNGGASRAASRSSSDRETGLAQLFGAADFEQAGGPATSPVSAKIPP